MDGETRAARPLLAKGAVPHRLDVTHSMNSSQSAPVKVTPAGDRQDAEAERKLRTSVGHPLPLAVPGTAGPGISGMLPEEMLIHDNTSPPRAPRVCCWGSWEHWALPSEKQLQGECRGCSRRTSSPPTRRDLLGDSRGRRTSLQNEEVAAPWADRRPAALREEEAPLPAVKGHKEQAPEPGLPLEEQAWMTLDFQRLLENRSFT